METLKIVMLVPLNPPKLWLQPVCFSRDVLCDNFTASSNEDCRMSDVTKFLRLKYLPGILFLWKSSSTKKVS